MELIAFFIGITVLGLLSLVWGADTRGLGDWQPRPEDWALPSRPPLRRISTTASKPAVATREATRESCGRAPVTACAEA